jgi:peroxiredoxin Q/BCP
LLAPLGCAKEDPQTTSPLTPAPVPTTTQEVTADPGLKVGESAPKFVLKDQEGQERSLDDFLKRGKVALVFLRAVGSSPHDRQHLVDLKGDLKKIEGAGVQIVAISSDTVGEHKKFADAQKIPYPLLSDDGAKTIKAYGVDDPKDSSVALPGTVLIDGSGVIRSKSFLSPIQLRQTVGELIEAAQKAG